MTSLLRSGGI